MIFVIQTDDEIAGLDITHALSLVGIQHTILSKQRDNTAQQLVEEGRVEACARKESCDFSGADFCGFHCIRYKSPAP